MKNTTIQTSLRSVLSSTIVFSAFLFPLRLAYAQELDFGDAPDSILVQKLTAPFSPERNSFTELSISRDWAIIGSLDAGTTREAGVAYLFRWDDTRWVYELTLTSTVPHEEDHFGVGVSIDWDWAMVGAWQEDYNARDTGSVYFFQRTIGGTWECRTRISATQEWAHLGRSVSISRPWAIAGAEVDWKETIPFTGAAYIFKRDGFDWEQRQKLTARDAAEDDRFGFDVCISGEWAIVGANKADHAGLTDAGAAYIFRRIGEVWHQEDKLIASDAADEDHFGRSVSVFGDWIIIGAPGRDYGGSGDAGAAYIYHRGDSGWEQVQTLISSAPAWGAQFGFEGMISDDYAIIGANLEDTDGGINMGSAYIFRKFGSLWVEQQKLTAFDPRTNSGFGHSVGISGDHILVGATRAEYGLTWAGAVYAYQLNSVDRNYPTIRFNNGARHAILPGLHLGTGVDVESDGQPHPRALGDDLEYSDDEDGLIDISALYPGEIASMEVWSSAEGYLDGWIDFNGDGNWAQPEDKIFAESTPVIEGSNTIEFPVPTTAQMGKSFMRLRLSREGYPWYYGFVDNGEVEDYEVNIKGKDFGDAPEPDYPTTRENNGASHEITPFCYLGAGVDAEYDGQPHDNALGDDRNGNDEDGVIFSPLIPDSLATVTVFASESGYLNAWMDFNIKSENGWVETDEHIFFDEALTAGDNDLTFTVPTHATLGQTFARFRFSKSRGLTYQGSASSGEVEDYEVTIREATDFGDAPDPTFPTLLANDGARHKIVHGIFLGDKIDDEADGQPEEDALGDDYDIFFPPGNDDEDGVIFTTFLVPGSLAGVRVKASVPGKLNAWIDFDGNNRWSEPDDDDQIFTNQDLEADEWNELEFVVPTGIIPGPRFARFRFNTMGDLSFFGSAHNGEVEDYKANILFIDGSDPPGEPGFDPDVRGGGAYHHIVRGVHLGFNIDAELARADPDGLGDDKHGIDDEDGVVFTSALWPGKIAGVQVIASEPGFLNAWIDFYANGNWKDMGEQIFVDKPLAANKNQLTFYVPQDAVVGQTFAQFRYNSAGGLSPFGPAKDGEVEVHAVKIGQESNIKWSQLPLKNPQSPIPDCFWGWDETSIYGKQVVADDWLCMDDRPITDIQWWGSYSAWDSITPPPNAPAKFLIGIWKDVPAGVDKPYSHPGQMIWLWSVEREMLNERWAGRDFYPDYMDTPEACFRYDFKIAEEDWFYPQGDSTIYWICISAVDEVVPDQNTWGWKTREHYFNDNAVRIHSPKEPVLGSLFESGEPIKDLNERSWDMAFELISGEPKKEKDYGDAPDKPYATLQANMGASHVIVYGLFLGTDVDSEPDGQPHPSALGDDALDGNDDDDGVVFESALQPCTYSRVIVTASDIGALNAWIDFNANGDWANPSEHIFIDELLLPGPNILTFSVPGCVVSDSTFARFRFSSKKGLGYSGPAPDGEVEDYVVKMIPTGVEQGRKQGQIPTEFALLQNYPNPFNPETTIEYHTPQAAFVKLTIYDLQGGEVHQLLNETVPPGTHSVKWDSKNESGQRVSSGIYFYRLEAVGKENRSITFVDVKKMILMK